MKFLSTSIAYAIGLLLLSILTNALPGPQALHAAIVESGSEIVARDGDISEAKTGAKLVAREAQYCFTGWNQINFHGASAWACCTSSCCWFDHDLLSNHLFSAKVTKSTSGGVRLWTSYACTGESYWIDFDGYRNLGSAPAFHSMSLS